MNEFVNDANKANMAGIGQPHSARHTQGYIKRPIAPPSKQIHDITAAGTPRAFIPPTQPPAHDLHVATDSHEQISNFEAQAKLINEPLTQQFVKVQSKRNFRTSVVVLYAMATILVITGVAVSVNGFVVNRHVAATVGLMKTKDDSSANGDSQNRPSTQKLTESTINNYAVAPQLPRYIDIAKLGIHARVLSMGVNNKNQLQAPSNVYDAGWYNGSSQPGMPGAMLIDGHISSWTTHGVFYALNKLSAGDVLTITRGDGKQYSFIVKKTATLPSDTVNMSSLLVSQDPAKPGLNLISCSGEVIPGTNEFDKRIVVYATQQ